MDVAEQQALEGRSASPSARPRKSAGPPRYGELDGLRGIAALVVVLHHALLTFPGAWAVYTWSAERPRDGIFPALMQTPLYTIFNGSGAVIVFFVLSGVVLSLTYDEVDKWSYWPYLVKRLCRIWLPFAVVLTGSLLLYLALGGRQVSGLSGFRGWVH